MFAVPVLLDLSCERRSLSWQVQCKRFKGTCIIVCRATRVAARLRAVFAVAVAVAAVGSFNKYKSSERLRAINHKLVQQQWRQQQSRRRPSVSQVTQLSASTQYETIERKSKSKLKSKSKHK